MTNIDYVTFDTAQLLKEAGYPQETSLWSYRADGKMTCTDNGIGCCDAPHLYDAMKWLREEKEIFVAIKFEGPDEYYDDAAYYYELHEIKPWGPETIADDRDDIPCCGYEGACNSGIAAACEWLLGKKHSKKA